MKIGAWYDHQQNELHVRLRGATPRDSQQTLLALSAILQTVPCTQLRAMGQAIEATLKEDGLLGHESESVSPDAVLTWSD